MRMRPRLVISCCIALLFAMLSGSVFAQAYKKEYVDATKEIADGNYAEAVSKLQRVVDKNPKSQARMKMYGMLFKEYLPHYYLGQAYLGMDDCESAMTSWQAAIDAGVIQANDDFSQMYSQMQSDMKTCRTAGIDINSLAAQTTSEIDNLDTAIGSYLRLRDYAVLERDWSTSWEPLFAEADRTAKSLRQQVATATQQVDPVALERISTEARDMASRLNSTERDALAQADSRRRSQEAEQMAAIQAARSELQNVIRQANAAEKPSGGNSQMSSLLADLNEQVTIGRNLGSTASEANIREQIQNINNILRRYSASVQDWRAQQQSLARLAQRTPPPELKRIAEAYFTGDYETAVGLVRPENFSEDRARIQALLFRAAANHKLYVRGGEKSREVLRQIQVDIQAIKRMNSNFSPYIAAFSPSFLSLFRQTG